MPPPRRVAVTLEQCWHRVPGGTATAALELVRALGARPDVSLVGVAARHRSPAPDPFQPSIPVAHLPLPRPALYESWHRLRRPRVELAAGPVDVIHATTLAVPPRSAPLVVTVHDLAFLHEPGHFTKRGLQFFDRGLALVRAEADLVLCSSSATLADCRAVGIPDERLRLVLLGVRPRPATPDDVATVRRRYDLPGPYLLWVGTIEPRKNLGGLLAAYRALDSAEALVLAGPQGWHEDLGALLDTLPGEVRERVRPLGFVPDDDMGALYAGASVFCYPSLREGFGLPVLEAMAQGTPVVTSAGTATEEVAGGAGVLCDPRDPNDIAAGIGSLLGDPALAAATGARGRRRAGQLTWERTATQVVAAYADVTR